QDYPLTDTHRRVRSSGVLRVSDLVLGTLEHGIEPSTRSYATLVKVLCSAAGMTAPGPPSEPIDAFRQQLSRRVRASFEYFATLDASMEGQQFILYETGHELTLQPFGVFGGYRFDRSRSAWLARGNVIQASRYFSDGDLAMLADLIRRNASEVD